MKAQAQFESADTPSSASTKPFFIPFGVVAEIFALAVLLIVAFWPILTGMYGSWFDENAYMEHGILVIPAAGYMAWEKRDVLRRIPRQASPLGILLLFWGALQA